MGTKLLARAQKRGSRAAVCFQDGSEALNRGETANRYITPAQKFTQSTIQEAARPNTRNLQHLCKRTAVPFCTSSPTENLTKFEPINTAVMN